MLNGEKKNKLNQEKNYKNKIIAKNKNNWKKYFKTTKIKDEKDRKKKERKKSHKLQTQPPLLYIY